MLKSIKKIFGMGPKTDYRDLLRQGAIVLDVRSKGEYAGGHIRNSINIPVDQLRSNLTRLKDKNQSIICCCASGMRSGSAKRILEAEGYTAVFNGGGWMALQRQLG